MKLKLSRSKLIVGMFTLFTFVSYFRLSFLKRLMSMMLSIESAENSLLNFNESFDKLSAFSSEKPERSGLVMSYLRFKSVPSSLENSGA